MGRPLRFTNVLGTTNPPDHPHDLDENLKKSNYNLCPVFVYITEGTDVGYALEFTFQSYSM